MSEPIERYLALFIQKYNAQIVTGGVMPSRPVWKDLPPGVRASITAALAGVVHQVTEELY